MNNSLASCYKQMFLKYPDVVTLSQMCEMLGGISHKTGYKLLKEKRLASLKIGREYRIPKIYILKYLDSETNDSSENA